MRIDGSAGAVGSSVADASSGGKDHARLVDAAQQFEAMLMGEMLKPMQKSESPWNEGEDGGDKSADTMTAYGTEAVAKAISKAGGLGIAKQVLRQVGLESARSKGNS